MIISSGEKRELALYGGVFTSKINLGWFNLLSNIEPGLAESMCNAPINFGFSGGFTGFAYSLGGGISVPQYDGPSFFLNN